MKIHRPSTASITLRCSTSSGCTLIFCLRKLRNGKEWRKTLDTHYKVDKRVPQEEQEVEEE